MVRKSDGPVIKLTKKETQIVLAIADGLTDKEVGLKLDISIETVKSYERRIRSKLDQQGLDGHTRVRLARLVWEDKIDMWREDDNVS